MSSEWQIQEAKNRLSQLIKDVSRDGPQIITVRGKPTAVLLSIEEYRRLTHSPIKLTEFFRESPLHDEELLIERNSDWGREVEL
ncbi:type II toxin-antitoxin system Phd/YefM family antitoxin [Alicyclobacillus sp. TC]|uniref:Antitoxin n=1 Tax=Alicyclobacillus tolerans TaxID=90970 RepID=A0ABT9M0B8_9BACL|nr:MULTISPECIES: type II toxin-antitoxin system Phd/YefM family antitoxin [Alicyclobacillus]MDP9729816.1 prevent-host-death family protein [Alicyclobacillus tengchongensis]QRF23524.1 type II toxin-antitoxin system Phd/YefM family antitoxin [Alicyclobacillus sp. TC]